MDSWGGFVLKSGTIELFSVSARQKKCCQSTFPPSGAAQGKYLNGGYGNSWDAPWICHVKQARGKIVVYAPRIRVRRSQPLGAYRAGRQLAIKDKTETPLGRYLDQTSDTVDQNQVSRETGYPWCPTANWGRLHQRQKHKSN